MKCVKSLWQKVGCLPLELKKFISTRSKCKECLKFAVLVFKCSYLQFKWLLFSCSSFWKWIILLQRIFICKWIIFLSNGLKPDLKGKTKFIILRHLQKRLRIPSTSMLSLVCLVCNWLLQGVQYYMSYLCFLFIHGQPFWCFTLDVTHPFYDCIL